MVPNRALAQSIVRLGFAGAAEMLSVLLPSPLMMHSFFPHFPFEGLLSQGMRIQGRRYARTALQTGDKSRRPHEEDAESQAVTFVSSQSFVSLPKWDAHRNGSISLKFRTNEGTGVLVFSHGIKNTGANGDSDSSNDYFAIELLNGHVFLLMNMGSGGMKVKSSSRRIDDGNWHSISVTREGRTGRVSVDDNSVAFISPASSTDLDLEGSLFVGAIGTTGFLTTASSTKWPPVELWSASLGLGFVGCVKDLVVNQVPQDLSTYALEQDSGGVRVGCTPSSRSRCLSSSCQNQGTCIEGWNRRICQCAPTGYTGPNCAKESLILSFSGDQFFKLDFPHESVTQAEDLYLRFRSMKSSGLILAGTSETLVNFLVVSLDSGRLKVLLNLGEGNKVTQIGYNLNDDVWHSLKIERRGPWLEIKLDALHQVAEITGMLITLQIDSIYLGSMGSKKMQDLKSIASDSPFYQAIRDIPSFGGSMQSLVFNGQDLIELSRSSHMDGISESTAEFDSAAEREQIEYSSSMDAVTFKSKWTFVALPQMSAYSRMTIFFQFKTLAANGVILFNTGTGSQFVAVELANGRLVYSFNLGDGAKRMVSRPRTLNDNVWHSVAIMRSIFNHHSLRVDDETVTLSSPGVNTHLILRGLLYLGGVPAEMFSELPNALTSSNGYEGCLANIDLNGELVDPTDSDQVVVASTLVSSGCTYASFSAPSPFVQQQRCPLHTCFRRGVCVKYAADEFACDCDQSSFTDTSCSEEGISFRFGHVSSDTTISLSTGSTPSSPEEEERRAGGIVTVNFPDGHQIDTKSDTLSFGMMTGQEDSALLRVDSGTTGDYMELQIVRGNILMAYNLGTEDHVITDDRVFVSDNKYHIIRFTRSGPNSTLQIDNHNPVTRGTSGRKQMMVFDTLAKIQIGGRLERKPLPSPASQDPEPFIGIISGLTFNGMMILDLAEEKDERISIEGEVGVVNQLPKRFNPRNMESLLGNETGDRRSQVSHYLRPALLHDELILSRDELQVCWADSQCQKVGSPAPDDLITPFVTDTSTTTSSPAAISVYTDLSRGETVVCEEEDDEDCAEGSGDDADRGEDDEEKDVTGKGNSDVSVDERSAILPITGTFQFIPPTPASSTLTTRTSTQETTTRIRLPKTTPFIDPRDLEQSYRPRSTIAYPSLPKNRPEINEVPKPGIKRPGFYGTPSDKRGTSGKGNHHQVNRTTTFSSVDRMVLTVGVIATIIIVIVFVFPILLFARLRMTNMQTPPSVSSHMIYSQSGLGVGLSGHKSVPTALIAPDTSSLFHPLPATLSYPHNNQLEHRHHAANLISSPGPTSILKKKKDSGHEWYV